MAVMAQPWKHPQNGTYYFRREVPKDIRQILGKREWKVSLKSKDLATIRPRFASEAARCEEIFLAAREQLQGRSIVLSSDAPKLADRWTAKVMEEWEANPDAIDEFLATEYPEGQDSLQVPASKVLDIDNPKTALAVVLPYIQSTLRDQGLPMPAPGDASREALQLSFLSRWHDLCRMAFDRHGGDWRTSIHLPNVEKPLASEAGQDNVIQSLPMVSKVFTEWAEYQRGLSIKEKTVETYGATITRFTQLLGDMPVHQIKRRHIQDFMSALLKVPTQGAGIRKLTIQEAIAKGEAENLPKASPATVKNQLRGLGAVLQYAKARHEGMTEEPVTASGVIKDLSKRITRSPSRLADEKGYSRRELRTIFTSPIFTDGGWSPPKADYGRAMYWIPLILAYTGARREEIAKLYTSDIAQDQDTGLWAFQLRSIGDETVKTGTSHRKVPVHADLIDLGLLEYADSLPKGSRLFPKLTLSQDGFGHSVGKKWGEYLKDVVKLDTRADPSHGFRHTFKTLCREVAIPKEVQDWITGHGYADVADKYGVRPIVRMHEEMKKFPSIAKEVGLLPRKD